MTASTIDRTIERLARRQHGAFSDRQARQLGASSRMKRRRVASGQWLRLDGNVFAMASHPGTWFRQCIAATLSIDRAVLSHSSAAALHGFDGFRRGSQHITVPPDSTRRSRLAKVHQQGWPQGTKVNGIPVVTLPDTFFQLVADADSERVEHAFADAIVQQDWLLSAVTDRYVDLVNSRLPGVAIIRMLLEQLDDATAPPNSELERILDSVLGQVKGLPPLQRRGNGGRFLTGEAVVVGDRSPLPHLRPTDRYDLANWIDLSIHTGLSKPSARLLRRDPGRERRR